MDRIPQARGTKAFRPARRSTTNPLLPLQFKLKPFEDRDIDIAIDGKQVFNRLSPTSI